MRTFGCVLLALIITGCQPAPEEHQVIQAGLGSRPASGTMDSALDGEGPVRVRRLWSRPPSGFGYMSPAPNATFATTMDGNSGDLAIMDFQSQTIRRVTDKGSWSESSDYAETSVVSPDNSQIAYAWNVRSGDPRYELRVIGVDGSNMRVLWASRPHTRMRTRLSRLSRKHCTQKKLSPANCLSNQNPLKLSPWQVMFYSRTPGLPPNMTCVSK